MDIRKKSSRPFLSFLENLGIEIKNSGELYIDSKPFKDPKKGIPLGIPFLDQDGSRFIPFTPYNESLTEWYNHSNYLWNIMVKEVNIKVLPLMITLLRYFNKGSNLNGEALKLYKALLDIDYPGKMKRRRNLKKIIILPEKEIKELDNHISESLRKIKVINITKGFTKRPSTREGKVRIDPIIYEGLSDKLSAILKVLLEPFETTLKVSNRYAPTMGLIVAVWNYIGARVGTLIEPLEEELSEEVYDALYMDLIPLKDFRSLVKWGEYLPEITELKKEIIEQVEPQVNHNPQNKVRYPQQQSNSPFVDELNVSGNDIYNPTPNNYYGGVQVTKPTVGVGMGDPHMGNYSHQVQQSRTQPQCEVVELDEKPPF